MLILAAVLWRGPGEAVKARPHERIRLTLVPERIHFFESKTEAVIK